MQTVGGDLGDNRAFTWRTPSQIHQPSANGRDWEDVPAVRMSTYHDSYGPIRPDSFLEVAAQAGVQGTPLPTLLLDAMRCLPFRYAPTDDQVRAPGRQAPAGRRNRPRTDPIGRVVKRSACPQPLQQVEVQVEGNAL